MKQTILVVLLLITIVCKSQTSDERQSLDNNECFVATTSSISTTAAIGATFNHVLTINNPTGSGYKIYIDYFQFFMSGTNLMIPTSALIFKNPTLITTNIASTNNLDIGSTVVDNTTVFGYDLRTTPLSGSTGYPYEIPQNSGDKFGIGKLKLREGQSIGINLSKLVGIGVAVSSGILMVYYHRIPN